MPAAEPASPAGHCQVGGRLRAARRACRLALQQRVLEAFANPIQRDAGVATPIGRHAGDRFLQLVEPGAPVTQLALHGIHACGGVDLREPLLELPLELRRFVEVFLNGHYRESGIGNRDDPSLTLRTSRYDQMRAAAAVTLGHAAAALCIREGW